MNVVTYINQHLLKFKTISSEVGNINSKHPVLLCINSKDEHSSLIPTYIEYTNVSVYNTTINFLYI